MKHIHILYNVAMLAALSLTACSDDAATELVPDAPAKEEAPKLANVNVSISARSFSGALTRGDNTAPDGTTVNIQGTPNEHINDWFMILVHAGQHENTGKIAKIIKRSDSGVVTDPSSKVLRESFNIGTLASGKYHIFTFGNISYADFQSAVGEHLKETTTPYTLSEGMMMPDIKDLAWDRFHNQAISLGNNIPLSSVDSDLQVDGDVSMEVELERVIGKMQFYFANHTNATSLKIMQFEMMPLRNKTYLLEHDIEGGLVATPPHHHNNEAETVKKDVTEDFAGGWAVPVHTDDLFDACSSLGFYVNESVPEVSADYPLGHFKMKLTLDREGVTETRSSMLHNLTATERNQFYLQPIMFTDWVLQPEIHYYPPIGGYPVVQVEENSSFEECYSTFEGVTSSSPFQIRLRIHDLANPDKWYDVTDGIKVKDKVTVGGVQREQPYMVIVHDPDNVINHTTLSLDNSGLIKSPDGQLTGHFTGNQGRAIISVYANIEISTGVYYTYERDLYVITK